MDKLTTAVLTNLILFTVALSSVLAVEEAAASTEPQEGLGVFVLILGVLALFFVSAFSLNRSSDES